MEIEVKARLKDREGVITKLKELGCEFGVSKTQDDTVYAQNIGTVEEYYSNSVFLRIRIQDDGKVIFTAKQPIRKSASELVKVEHESEISSADEMREMLKMMGYREAVRTKKTRQIGHYNDYEICLDDIEGLGSFIEIEKIAEENIARMIQKEMLEFLISLGTSPEDQVMKGYDILQLEQKI